MEAQQPQNIIYSTNEPPANPSIDAAPTPSSYPSVPTTMEEALVPPIKHNTRTPARGEIAIMSCSKGEKPENNLQIPPLMMH
jgi:hypothetical protein